MNVIDTSGMSRDEWLALRRQSIGASDAPVIAGLSKYKSRFQLWLEKTGQGEPEEAGEQARWGSRLEDDIEEELGLRGVRLGSRQLMARHHNWPWATATLDGVDQDGEIWEFKSSGFQTAAPLLDGEVKTLPSAWVIQAHHQMLVGERDRVNFAVFIGHRLQLYQFVVDFDPEIADGLSALLVEFRRHVEDGTPPSEFDPQDAAVLLDFYKKTEGETIDLDPAIYDEHITNYRESSAELRYATKTQKIAKAALLAAMANAPAARCGNVTLARKLINVRASNPKPKAAYSYVKFSMSGIEEEE